MENHFLVVCILLARVIQEKAQMALGIREALTLIIWGKQESTAGFRLLDMLAGEFLDLPGEKAKEAEYPPPIVPPLQ